MNGKYFKMAKKCLFDNLYSVQNLPNDDKQKLQSSKLNWIINDPADFLDFKKTLPLTLFSHLDKIPKFLQMFFDIFPYF